MMLSYKMNPQIIESTLCAMQSHADFDKKICRLELFDVSTINNLWKNTKDYIGAFHTIQYASAKTKLLNSRDDILCGKVTVPPYIYVDNNGNVDFYNGRNRFANLRDAGVSKIPCVIEKADYRRLVKITKRAVTTRSVVV
jgi:hypothetical protein